MQKTKSLTPEALRVIRDKGTEVPSTGIYNRFEGIGTYLCRQCGLALFRSDHKFLSTCGWPSFDQEIEAGKIKEVFDESHGMRRTEIVCANCEGHLGHVFNDGPTETGLRYCVNSLSLDFQSDD